LRFGLVRGHPLPGRQHERQGRSPISQAPTRSAAAPRPGRGQASPLAGRGPARSSWKGRAAAAEHGSPS
jgi:hypothetical protein